MLTGAPVESPTQARLAELLAERVAWVGGPTSAPETTLLVLLRSLSPADVAAGARAFPSTLEPAEAAGWRRSWTRTRFLFGNPANLRPGDARLVAPGATVAWLGPFPDGHRPGVGRLLKPVTGRLPQLPDEIDVPGGGAPRTLWIAVGRLTVVDYLVHLHHTVAEAVLLGRLRPDERLRLRHRPVLDVGADGPAYARVLPEPGGTGRLRLHTWLSFA